MGGCSSDSLEMGLFTLWGVAHLCDIKTPSSLQALFVFSSTVIRKAEKTKMSLTDVDKCLIRAFWDKVSVKADAIGHEALVR